jgi:hypothetical protein
MALRRQQSDDHGRRRSRPDKVSSPGPRPGEDAFALALRLAQGGSDARALAATLVHRGRRRLEAADPGGGADWGTALALAVSVEAALAQRVVATTGRWAREHCLGGADDALLSAALASLIESAEASAATLTLGEPERSTLAVVLNAFRVIGAVCAYHEGSGSREASAYADTARAGATEVDRLTSSAFALADLVAKRLP